MFSRLYSFLILTTFFLPLLSNNLPKDALYDAIMKNSVNEIVFASHAGVDLDSCRCGKPGLVWAVLFDKFDSAEALLKCGANPQVTYLDKSMVAYAFESSNMDLACLLARYGANKAGYEPKITSYLNQQLVAAIQSNELNRIHRLGFLGADVQNPKYVDLAVQQKKSEVLRTLIELGASVNRPYHSLLLKALNNGDNDSAYILIENGAGIFEKNVGPKGNHDYTVLSNIIYRINHCGMSLEQGVSLIKLLIKRGYLLNGDSFADNAFFLTLNYMFGSNLNPALELLHFFVQEGVDVNRKIDTRDWLAKGLSVDTYTTPLFMAIRGSVSNNRKSLDAVALLVKNGADVNLEACPCEPNRKDLPKKAMRPLFYAVKLGCPKEVIDLLIEQGACL